MRLALAFPGNPGTRGRDTASPEEEKEPMKPPMKKILSTLALTLACSLCAFGLGVATGPDSGAVANPEALALSETGSTVRLTSSQLQTAEENSEPLDPEDATFPSNVDLTEAEVGERAEEVGESYEIGESVTLEDLEFLRIYAFSAEASQSEQVVTVAHMSSADTTIELASAQTFPFNGTRTLFGTKANITGSVTANIGGGISSSWSVNWTAKRVSGTATTKITSQAHVYAYGLTSVSPYVGLIYQSHPTATSTAQSMGFARTGNLTGVTYYMTIDAVSTFYSSAGSFQISGF